MKAHHLAWLDAHPERTMEWLKRMMFEGFQVHHIDGDNSNNEPSNLALIESVDHMRLHGLLGLVCLDVRAAASKGGKTRMSKMSKAELRKHQQAASNARWRQVRRQRARAVVVSEGAAP